MLCIRADSKNNLEVVKYDNLSDKGVEFIFNKTDEKNGNAPIFRIMKRCPTRGYYYIGETAEDNMADEGCHFRNALDICGDCGFELTLSDMKDLIFFIEYLNGLNKVVMHREGDLIIPVYDGVWREDLAEKV